MTFASDDRRRWFLVALAAAAVVGAVVPLSAAVSSRTPWWLDLVTGIIAVVAGISAGSAFGSRERDVFAPTRAVAVLVAFLAALTVPFCLWLLLLVVLLFATHSGR